MGASCYLCSFSNYGVLPGQSPGDAVGACKTCGILVCLGHGIHNPSDPSFKCGICIPNLLAAAASRKQGPGGTPPSSPETEDQPLPDRPLGYSRWAAEINEVEDVIPDLASDRWSSIRNDIEYLSRSLESDGALTEYLSRSLESDGAPTSNEFAGPDARQARALMAAAIAIAAHLNLPEHDLTPVLRRFTAAALLRRG